MTVQDTAYHDTQIIVPDVTAIPNDCPASYAEDVRDLFDTWHSHLGRNRMLTEMYRMHNKFVDLGIVKLPAPFDKAREIVGWPKKAVDVMAVRSRFDGFVFAGQRNPELDAMYRMNRMKAKYARAARGALVHGLSAFTVMRQGEGGSATSRVRSFSANQHAILWDKEEERPKCGVTLSAVDIEGRATRYVVFEPEHVLVFSRGQRRRDDRWEWSCESIPNPVGRPLIEPLIYDPDDDRPLGHSRITPEVIGITEKAMRDVLNMDVAGAFWTFPQRYMLGVDSGLFADDVVGEAVVVDENGKKVKLKTRLETYINSILALTRDEQGNVPTVGQFSPLDPGGLIRVFENDAQRFSGATHVPLGQLGVLSNTYTSSDALGAANDPLILDVEAMNDENADHMAEVARLMMCVARNCTVDGLTDEERAVEAYFADPSQPTLAARADGWTKLAAVDGSIVGTQVWYEGLGLSHATIDRLESEKQSQSATDSLAKIAEAVAGGSLSERVDGGQEEVGA